MSGEKETWPVVFLCGRGRSELARRTCTLARDVRIPNGECKTRSPRRGNSGDCKLEVWSQEGIGRGCGEEGRARPFGKRTSRFKD